jgi:hypothetical protein
MNNIQEIMDKLKYMNQFARILKEEESCRIEVSQFLIDEYEDSFTTQDGRIITNEIKIIYSKPSNLIKVTKNDRTYEYGLNENSHIYAGREVDIEKLVAIRDCQITYQKLYEMKTDMIRKLYRLGFFNVERQGNSILFRYLDTHAYHVPFDDCKAWIDTRDIESTTVLNKKRKTFYPNEIRITAQEAKELYEEVNNLAKDL